MSDGTTTEPKPAVPAFVQAPVPAPPKATIPATGTVPETGKTDGDEPLGPNGLKALEAEREARKDLEKRLNALKPLEQIAAALGGGDADKGKSEIEQLAERHAELAESIVEERQARWRAELANEYGLTPKQARRLAGATRDEMTADAEDLVKDFEVKPKNAGVNGLRPKPDRSQGGGAGGAADGKAAGLAEARRRGFGSKTTQPT
jgi:hypothetical protein